MVVLMSNGWSNVKMNKAVIMSVTVSFNFSTIHQNIVRCICR